MKRGIAQNAGVERCRAPCLLRGITRLAHWCVQTSLFRGFYMAFYHLSVVDQTTGHVTELNLQPPPLPVDGTSPFF